MIIAIDGPAGSGKSTIAQLIANDLGLVYLDTGAMYRVFTLKVMKEKIDFNDMIIAKNVKENSLYLLSDDSDFSNYDGIDINWYMK